MIDDWREEIKLRLNDSILFKQLKNKCKDDTAPVALVEEGVFYCYQRTKTVIRHMNEYTLHDADHLFHVLNIMGRIIPNSLLNVMSTPELMLLIMTAFFHDIGMAPDEIDVNAWEKYWDISPNFANSIEEEQFRRFSRFASAHPTELDNIEHKRKNGIASEVTQLKNYLISDYIRGTHSQRAKEIIKKDWNEKILYRDIDLTVEFAELCHSHCEDTMNLLRMDSSFICSSDTLICFPLLGVILRIADLLDFDSKRAPSVLYSHLYVKHPISIKEWNKHRSVDSWIINSELFALHARCNHPAIQAALNDYCDIIDNELMLCNNILSSISPSISGFKREINFRLPIKVNRDRIETKKDIDGKPIYYFTKTQFNLSKKQVIDLLMGTKLYGNSEVALRELIQNSIDACLLRKSLEKKWGNNYEPKIMVRYYSENGEDYLSVNDNGTGMDQYIVDTYYSKVGSSFYTSSDYYDLRSEFKPEFIPTSRFGIGILSCFMVSDTIITETRKVTGPNTSSEPLNITIEGQESIFWVKAGSRDSVGTDTCLVLRKKKHPWDKMSHEEFISSVKNIIPNPPFKIEIIADLEKDFIDENCFQKICADDLAKSNWEDNDNVKQIDIDINRPEKGFIGSIKIGLLELHETPVDSLHVTSTSVEINGEDYILEKTIKMSTNEIELISSSITIDDDGNIEESKLTSKIAESKSRISLHGIEIPSSLFPRSWEIKSGQPRINWPFPIVIVIDICGNKDLDLNSSRTQILGNEKWSNLEEELAFETCYQIKEKVEEDYWMELVDLFKKSKNEVFLSGLKRVIDFA